MRLTTNELLLVAKNISDLIHKLVDSDEFNVSIDWKEYYYEGIDPFNCQTECGLFLEEYNGMPCYIYTPLGRWKIMDRTTANGNEWNKIMENLKNNIELELFIPKIKVNTCWTGIIGPIWKIIRFNNQILPISILRNKSCILTPAKCMEDFRLFLEENPLDK